MTDEVKVDLADGILTVALNRPDLRNAFNEWKAGMPETQPLSVCYYNLGLAHLTANNAAEAKEAFRNAADADPNWALPPIWFGFFAALDGDATAARKYWDNALKLEPDNGMLREQLGYLAIAMGLQKEADAHFKEALRVTK